MGVVYVEFLASFVAFFTLFVCTVQMSVLATAKLVVRHAAAQAVRAAVVIIDDDPVFYEDDGKRKHLESKGSGNSGDATQTVQKMLARMAGDQPSGLSARGAERLRRIRNAAYLPLSVVSPPAEQVARWISMAGVVNPERQAFSVRGDLGDHPALRMMVGFGFYGRVAAAVTFPVAPGSRSLRSSNDAEFKDRETVTVRVTYLLPCNVPLARELLCQDLADMTGIKDAVRNATDALATAKTEGLLARYKAWRKVSSHLKKKSQQLEELANAEWSPLQLSIYAQPNERFVILSGEASLPNHGASYKYRSELQSEPGDKP